MERKEILKSVYLKVVKNFPEIDPEEIKLDYITRSKGASLLLVNSSQYIKNDKIVIDPRIFVGQDFFDFPEEEKEAIISHELGHYMFYKNKNYSHARIRRLLKWTGLVYITLRVEDEVIFGLMEKDAKMRHKVERLHKWSILIENYAENEAIKAGYGPQRLSRLRRILEENISNFSSLSRKVILARIENLEKKLEE